MYIDDCEMTISTVEVRAGPSLPLRGDVRRMTVQSIVFCIVQYLCRYDDDVKNENRVFIFVHTHTRRL